MTRLLVVVCFFVGALITASSASSEPPTVSVGAIQERTKTGVNVCVASSRVERPWTMRIFDEEFAGQRNLSRGVRLLHFHLGDADVVKGSSFYKVVFSGDALGECAKVLLTREFATSVSTTSTVFGGFNIRASTGGRIRSISTWQWRISSTGAATIQRLT